jgi:hypothetical protein
MPPFSKNQIKDAELDKRSLLTTLDLYKAYYLIEEGILEKENVRRSLLTKGLINLHEYDLVKIGVAGEVYQNGHIIIINLKDVIIKNDDILVAEHNKTFTKLSIESMQIDDKNVKVANNCEVGIKIDKPVLKKSIIYKRFLKFLEAQHRFRLTIFNISFKKWGTGNCILQSLGASLPGGVRACQIAAVTGGRDFA